MQANTSTAVDCTHPWRSIVINSGDRKLRVSVPFVSFIASLCSTWKAEPKKLRVFAEDLRAVTKEKAKRNNEAMPAFSQYWWLWNQRYSWQWERLLFIIIQLMQWSSHCVSHKPALIALLDCYISRSQCSIRVAQVSLFRVKAVCK